MGVDLEVSRMDGDDTRAIKEEFALGGRTWEFLVGSKPSHNSYNLMLYLGINMHGNQEAGDEVCKR